jgi:hypothetical protein
MFLLLATTLHETELVPMQNDATRFIPSFSWRISALSNLLPLSVSHIRPLHSASIRSNRLLRLFGAERVSGHHVWEIEKEKSRRPFFPSTSKDQM